MKNSCCFLLSILFLHRMFTATAGLTIQTYVQRRRLTEAAKLLAFSDKPRWSAFFRKRGRTFMRLHEAGF